MPYYVGIVEKKTQREVPFSRVECDDALDAAECAEFIEARNPKIQTIIVFVPNEAERAALAPHVCRGCNCQFDRKGALIHGS